MKRKFNVWTDRKDVQTFCKTHQIDPDHFSDLIVRAKTIQYYYYYEPGSSLFRYDEMKLNESLKACGCDIVWQGNYPKLVKDGKEIDFIHVGQEEDKKYDMMLGEYRKFYLPSGRLTPYAFSCGYVERYEKGDDCVVLSMENAVYHIKGMVSGKRIIESYAKIKDARKNLEKFCRDIDENSTKGIS